MNGLVGYLTDNCCAASGSGCEASCAPRTAKSVKRKTAA